MNRKISVKIPGQPEKSHPNYAEALAKFWMIVAAVSMGITMFFVLTLMQMAPHLKIVAQVLTTPMSSGQLIQAEPFESDISDKSLIEQMLVRNYLINRYMVYPDEMQMGFNWGPYGVVAQFSVPQVYNEFYQSLGELPEKLRDLQYTQNIKITSVSRQNDRWTVDFDIYRLYAGGHVSVRSRTAVLETRNIPSRRFFRTDSSNPYGLTVIWYTDAEKKQASS
ncbi:MAG: VirB8/TrbF family protein [Alphaproteobacteria bacterium]